MPERHKWEHNVSSVDHHGCLFYLTLPHRKWLSQGQVISPGKGRAWELNSKVPTTNQENSPPQKANISV